MIKVFLTSIPWKISILRSPWTGSCNWLQCCDAFSSETEYWIKGGVLLWCTSSPPLALNRFTLKWLRISAYVWYHASPLLSPNAPAPFTRGVGVNAWRRACLMLGADATVIVTFLVLHERNWLASVLGYLHKVIWLADACVGTYSWKDFNSWHEQWSDATDLQFSSATLDVTPFKVSKRLWRWHLVWMGCNALPDAPRKQQTVLIYTHNVMLYWKIITLTFISILKSQMVWQWFS